MGRALGRALGTPLAPGIGAGAGTKWHEKYVLATGDRAVGGAPRGASGDGRSCSLGSCHPPGASWTIWETVSACLVLVP